MTPDLARVLNSDFLVILLKKKNKLETGICIAVKYVGIQEVRKLNQLVNYISIVGLFVFDILDLK